MKPTVITHVDGERRRITDYLAGHPWATQFMPFPTLRPESRRGASELASKINIEAASVLLRDRTVTVFADEVAQSLTAGHDAVIDAWLKTPGVMPPFESMFVEARTGAARTFHDFVAFAIHAQSMDLEDLRDAAVRSRPDDRDEILRRVVEHRRHEVRACVVAFVWCQRFDGTVWGPIASMQFPIDRSFKIMTFQAPGDFFDSSENSNDERAVGKPMVNVQPLGWLDGYEDAGTLVGQLISLAGATFVRTCGLMNASNVKTVEGGRTNEHVGAKRRARDRLATVRYYVLKLKVGTKLVPIAQPTGDGSLSCPLTPVRGHFKDFNRNGHGLFGKYKGEKYSHVWCPNFVRGRIEDGIVQRDYEQSTESVESPR